MDQRKGTDLGRAIKIGIIIGILMAVVTAAACLYEYQQSAASAKHVAELEAQMKAGQFHRPHSAPPAAASAAKGLTGAPATHAAAAPHAAPAAAAPGKPTPPSPAPATPAAPH